MGTDSINTIAVLGLGTMGPGIAQVFAAAGCTVRCFDPLASARDALFDRIRSDMQQMADAGIASYGSSDAILERISTVPSEDEAVVPADFVVETIFEDLALKQEVFARLDAKVSSQTILASNTSAFPMTQIAGELEHAERAVVAHWFNPPQIVPIVEVVGGQRTDEQTIRRTMAMMERIGKSPVHLKKELPGVLVDRVQIAMIREVWDLLDRGVASAEDIDRAIQGSMGFRMAAIGPLQVSDFAGLDIVSGVYDYLVKEIRSDTEIPPAIRKLVDQRRLGVKTGKGFYEYTEESVEQKRAQRDRLFLALSKLLYGQSV